MSADPDLQDLAKSVCAVIDPKGNVKGTGFFIASGGIALTCEHVIRGFTDTVRVKLFDAAGPVEATVLDVDADLDVALLKVSDADAAPLRPSSSWTVGMQLVSHGFSRDFSISRYPNGFPASFQLLNQAQVDNGSGPDDALVLDGSRVNQGLSGAPAIDAKTGRVVGMVRWRRGAEICFATPVSGLFQNWPVLGNHWKAEAPRVGWGNLPFVLDRQAQGTQALTSITDNIARSGPRPGFYIVHGPDVECPDAFLDVLKDEFLPVVSSGGPSVGWRPGFTRPPTTNDQFEWTNISWPRDPSGKSIETLNEAIRRDLAALTGVGMDLAGDDPSVDPLAQEILATDAPLLIRTTLDSQIWSSTDAKLLSDWAKYWQEFPDLGSGRLILIFVVVYYRSVPRGFWKRLFGDDIGAIRSAVDGLSARAETLPLLDPVAQIDAEDWARALDTAGLWTGNVQTVLNDISETFKTIGGSPADMKAVSSELEKILDNRADQQRISWAGA